jgi:large subunit ribosomal protein L13
MSQRTYSAKAKDIKRQWHVVDVSDKILGRAASQIASLLKGKHKAIYTPSIDTGDHVVVINAAQVKVTGKKEGAKKYYRQPRAGFPGALKTTTLENLRGRHPEDIIIFAVKRMLPRNALGRQMMTKLKVYPGAEHPHAAQKPQAREVEA